MLEIDDVIDEIAAQFGAGVAHHLGDGDEGSVYALSNGVVAKVTSSREEAAACLALMAAPPGAGGALPVIAAVRRVDAGPAGGVRAGAFDRADDAPVWVIVREDADPDLGLGEDWEELLARANVSFWRGGEARAQIRRAAEEAGLADEYGQIEAALAGLAERGVRYVDIQAANMGRLPSGRIAPFDFGHCEMGEAMLARADAPELALPLAALERGAPRRR